MLPNDRIVILGHCIFAQCNSKNHFVTRKPINLFIIINTIHVDQKPHTFRVWCVDITVCFNVVNAVIPEEQNTGIP
jgi:hypothetical protein